MPRRSANLAFAARLGQRLRLFRMRAGISQPKLAEMTGVSRALISEIELGKTVPSVETLFALADALQFNVDALRRPVDEALSRDLITIASWRARAEIAEAKLEKIRTIIESQ